MQRLHAACHEGDLPLVTKLITPGTINEKDEAGLTPICYAAKAGHIEIVLLLISNQANISGSAEDPRTNILYQACLGLGSNRKKPFMLAACLLARFATLPFTDGTKAHHAQLIFDLAQHTVPSIFTASIVNQAIHNRSNDRLLHWILINFFKASAHYLLSEGRLDDGIYSLEQAILYFECFEPTLDNELTDYVECLDLLFMCTSSSLLSNEKLLILKKIHQALNDIKNTNEITIRTQTYNFFNFAETYRSMGNLEGAKRYYQMAIEHMLNLSADARFIIEKLPDFFISFELCFPKNSPLRSFYKMAIMCFMPNLEVNNLLLDSLRDFTLQTNPDADMIMGVNMLIKVLRFVHNLNLLSNKALKELMDQPVTKQCMDRILDLIEYTPTIKEEVNAILNSSKNTLGQKTQQHQHLTFFTSSNPTNDTLNDNLPPVELNQTHSSTRSSS